MNVSAKGLQAPLANQTQDIKDSGRVNINWTIDNVATTQVAELLMTVTQSRDGGATATFTTYTIPAGKRLRLTSYAYAVENGGTVPVLSRTKFRVRYNTAGAVTTASPQQHIVPLSVAAAAKTIVNCFGEFPDGMEFLGDGTRQIGVTTETPDWVVTTQVPQLYLAIFGFEY